MPKQQPGERVVFATTSCATEYDSLPVHVNQGDVWAADDPFVRDRPDLFGDAPVVHRTVAPERKVERATRAPGEVRAPGRGLTR